jgi:hypothetical protein
MRHGLMVHPRFLFEGQFVKGNAVTAMRCSLKLSAQSVPV